MQRLWLETQEMNTQEKSHKNPPLPLSYHHQGKREEEKVVTLLSSFKYMENRNKV
jgi:hypothetical protein